ncbi:MAG: precorrin-4 C(11)-methyltransferase [Caloramator sp.]|nr:precorrin-4 C(11)-methyltransferase [Caloramator sp.]
MVYFVGAGPGDVDLITVKGRKVLSEADVVIYTGSLVNEKHLDFCKKECRRFNSASMTLEEIVSIIVEHYNMGEKVVRLHTGDSTLYGAIKEQMDMLDKFNVKYEVIPGVSSFTASCAAIKSEFTLPGVSQTVIITRIEGKTPVPDKEDLELLASHGSSMAIFLSVQDIDRVVEKLFKGYKKDVPVAVVYKATWEDEKIIVGKLSDIAYKVKDAGIKNFSQILVGDFINCEYEKSKLYSKDFSHGFRK